MQTDNHFKRATMLFNDGFRCTSIIPERLFKLDNGKEFLVRLPGEHSQVDRLIANLTKKEREDAKYR